MNIVAPMSTSPLERLQLSGVYTPLYSAVPVMCNESPGGDVGSPPSIVTSDFNPARQRETRRRRRGR